MRRMHVTAAVFIVFRSEQRPFSRRIRPRIACETVMHSCPCTTVGEITTKAGVDYPEIARETIRDIGYDGPDLGFEGRSGAILFPINEPVHRCREGNGSPSRSAASPARSAKPPVRGRHE